MIDASSARLDLAHCIGDFGDRVQLLLVLVDIVFSLMISSLYNFSIKI